MQEQIDLERILQIVRRRLPYALAVSTALLIASAVVIFSLPAVYRSTGKIAVQSQQIPSDLVRSTVESTSPRIGFTQQLVMTDAQLEKIIDTYQPYPPDRFNGGTADMVRELRAHILIDGIVDPFSSGRPTIAFSVSFEHGSPETAYNIANELVQLFLRQNALARTTLATETSAFLKQETDKLSIRARELEREVADFKQRYSNALPEHLGLRVGMLESAQSDLRSLRRDIDASEQEIRYLETQRSLYTSQPAIGGADRPETLTPSERLAALKIQLRQMSKVYTQSHPEVIDITRAITRLEADLRSGRAGSDDLTSAGIADPARADIEYKLNAAHQRVDSLREQQSALQQTIHDLQASIMETPQVERGLTELTQEYDTAIKEYEDVRAKQRQAELAESLEEKKMAERFVLLDPPAIPTDPERPKKPKLLAGAVFLSLASGAGVVVVAEALDTTIRDRAAIASLTGKPPFAVLPYLGEPRSRKRKRIRTSSLPSAPVVSLLLLVLNIPIIVALTTAVDLAS